MSLCELFNISEERLNYVEAKVVVAFLDSLSKGDDVLKTMETLMDELNDNEIPLAMYFLGKLESIFALKPGLQAELMVNLCVIYANYLKHGFDYIVAKFFQEVRR